MSDDTALLNAIIASPGDDLPRLIYADWLDDRGQADRAEFIRVQCEYARWFDPHEHAPRGGEMRKRIAELRPAGPTLQCPVCIRGLTLVEEDVTCRQCDGRGNLLVEYERGFIARLRGPLAAFWEERECGACGGSGEYSGNPAPCSHCSGSGRVSGPTAAFAEVVKRNPVEEIDFSDRSPVLVSGRYWAWFGMATDAYMNAPHGLPDPITAALVVGTVPEFPGQRVYATEAAARQALSDALIRLARDGQGLGDSRP